MRTRYYDDLHDIVHAKGRALRALANGPSAAHIDRMESGPSEIAILRWLAAVGAIVTASSVAYIAHYDLGFSRQEIRTQAVIGPAIVGLLVATRIFRQEASEAKMIADGRVRAPKETAPALRGRAKSAADDHPTLSSRPIPSCQSRNASNARPGVQANIIPKSIACKVVMGLHSLDVTFTGN